MISKVTDTITEALFVSDLQPSQAPSADALEAAVAETIQRYGTGGCAAGVAAEFGDHPEAAVRRMTWAREALRTAFEVSVLA